VRTKAAKAVQATRFHDHLPSRTRHYRALAERAMQETFITSARDCR
jgi:hypothetical protein